MTPSETKHVYERACRTKRVTPQEDEGRAWHRVLREYELRDVEAAVDAWWADTTPGSDGQPRGRWMPTPAELKPRVERELQRRRTAAATPKQLVWGHCPACLINTSAFVPVGDLRGLRCHRCGKATDEIYRGAA